MAHAHGARAAEAAARAGVRSIEHGVFLDEAAVQAMVDNDTWLVPTLLAGLEDDLDDDSPDWARAAAEAAPRSFGLARDAGVRIAMGTDAVGRMADRRLDELSLMHGLGMPPEEVWRASTSDAAVLLERDDLGRLEPGRRADIVAITGDVMDLDGLADRIARVWKDGREVTPN